MNQKQNFNSESYPEILQNLDLFKYVVKNGGDIT